MAIDRWLMANPLILGMVTGTVFLYLAVWFGWRKRDRAPGPSEEKPRA